MRFEQLLSRADDEVLQQLVGPPTVRLLNLLDPSLARPRRLRELITSLRSPEEMLRDQDARVALLDLLPTDEATTLAAAVGKPGKDPHAILRSARFVKGSGAEKALFEQLGVVPLPLHHSEIRTPVER